MNRWLWVAVGIGSLCVAFIVLSMIAFVALPFIMERFEPSPAGAVLIYEVDPETLSPGENVNMESLTTAIDLRLNPKRSWTRLAQVRKLDGRRIEVALIRQDLHETERVKNLLSLLGTLEFRILANTRDNKDLIEQALADPSKTIIRDEKGNLAAWWVGVAPGEEYSFRSPDIATRTREVNNRSQTEVLVVKDIYDLTGQYLMAAHPGMDPRTRKPCLNLAFDHVGGQLLSRLTSTHLPDEETGFAYRVGIILDGMVYSAPAIQSVIQNHAQITGSFTDQDVQDLVDVLNSGSLPVRIRLVEQRDQP